MEGAVHIHQVNERQILVNEKLVQQDMENNWVAKIELTPAEEKSLKQFIASISRM